MTRFPRIGTTIPKRTLASRKLVPNKHAVYLKLSNLELERQRRHVEIGHATSRVTSLKRRIGEIDREIARMLALHGVILPELGAVDPELDPGSGISIRY